MPVPEIGPYRKRLCLLRCRLTYAQQRVRELEALLVLHNIASPDTLTSIPDSSHDCFDSSAGSGVRT